MSSWDPYRAITETGERAMTLAQDASPSPRVLKSLRRNLTKALQPMNDWCAGRITDEQFETILAKERAVLVAFDADPDNWDGDDEEQGS